MSYTYKKGTRKHTTLVGKFCSCVGNVHKTMKNRTKSEGKAIAICVKSVLHTRDRTLKKFSCRGKKPTLQTQSMHH